MRHLVPGLGIPIPRLSGPLATLLPLGTRGKVHPVGGGLVNKGVPPIGKLHASGYSRASSMLPSQTLPSGLPATKRVSSLQTSSNDKMVAPHQTFRLLGHAHNA